MTSRSGRSHAVWQRAALIVALVFVLAMPSVALAIHDPYGGASYSAPYAPYTAGPVVREESADTRPYAPYTAGPVVREEAAETRPYAPYTAGPVVREDRPYAPYTAGPVVREEEPYAPYTAGPVVREER
jgi:hypothetical protein